MAKHSSESAGFFRVGGWTARGLLLATLGSTALGATLASFAVNARYERDVMRMVFNDNLQLLEDVRRKVGETSDSLSTVVSAPIDSVGNRPFIVVSIADHRLWYRQGNDVLFATRVATGSGKVLAQGKGNRWKFETPRGRLVVLSKESDPAWVPPDWHYVEVAQKKKLGLVNLVRGKDLSLRDGSVITVQGNEVVRRPPEGEPEALEVAEGNELIVDKKVIIPPFGTNQRRYAGVVGTHRLNLGDGYALHGTDVPSSIGTSVSHGCVRLRNEDIETLYRIVPVGTPVYIY
jgi:hypothetical protein